jgi:hypothetical protein
MARPDKPTPASLRWQSISIRTSPQRHSASTVLLITFGIFTDSAFLMFRLDFLRLVERSGVLPALDDGGPEAPPNAHFTCCGGI